MSKVILITIDCARTDAIYGNEAATPHIDRFKKDCAVFTEAFTQAGHTMPSMTSIFTSLYISDLKVYGNPFSPITHPYFLTRYLRKYGWDSLALCGTEGLSARMKKNFNICGANRVKVWGYEYSIKIIIRLLRFRIFRNLAARKAIRQLVRRLWGKMRLSAETLTNTAIRELFSAKKHDDRFIWLHYFDSHMAYTAPQKYIDPYLRRGGHYRAKCETVDQDTIVKRGGNEVFDKEDLVQLMAAYYGAISYIDENIGRLMEDLKRRGEYDDAMIIITADHGENLIENGVLFSHIKLFDETTKVPLLIKFPGNCFKGQTCSRMVEMVDIYPTILAQYKLPIPSHARGEDLAPYLTGEKKQGKTYAISEHVGKFQRSIRDGKWQFIETIPPEKWRVKSEEKHRLEIGRQLELEGDILLITGENNRNNYLDDYCQEALRLKNEADRIAARQ